MSKKIFAIIFCLFVMFAGWKQADACTNFLITKGASSDGSTMVSYAADSHVLYGELYHWPAQDYPEGAMLDIYEWDTGKFLCKIPQVRHTYNVIGNMNEHQLAIGETTYGGREELEDATGLMDYGNLIYVTLQRAKTAREAIYIISKFLEEHGYASSGETFSIADPNEVWIMDLIGKGTKMVTDKKGNTYNANKGAVWVARLIPDGYVSGHANHARITTFPLKGKDVITSKNIDKIYDKNVTTVYAYDVISFAKEAKLYEGPDEKFSFSDVYAPADFHATRFCELRVWAMFNKVTDGMDKYWDYATGKNIQRPVPAVEGQPLKPENFPTNRMPLWVLPSKKIDVEAMFFFMRDHLEGTELDMANDIGAGPFACPYRWRPMTWILDGEEYIHERVTATQQTGFSFVTQSRSWIPNNTVGGIIWFGVDDAASSVYVPMYTCMTRTPESFAVGNGDMMTWSETAAFWTFNQLTNFAYTRYRDIHPEIAEKQAGYEAKYVKEVEKMDKEAEKLFAQDPKMAVEFLTNYSVNTAHTLVKEWKDFYHYLFVKYLDGNIKTARPVPEGYKYYAPKVEQPRYSDEFYRVIIEKTGDKLKVIE